MKNGKRLLMAMIVCGTALFGCASQEVEKVEEPKVEQVKPVEEQPVKQEQVEQEVIEQEPVTEVEKEPVKEEPIEQEVTEPITEIKEEQPIIEEQPKAEYENGIWGDSKPNYEDLQTTKIELVKNSDNEVLMLYNGTILDYVNDVAKEENGESVDYELTSQLLMVAFCSIDEAETKFTLVDNEETVIYSYLNGEPVENGLEGLQ